MKNWKKVQISNNDSQESNKSSTTSCHKTDVRKPLSQQGDSGDFALFSLTTRNWRVLGNHPQRVRTRHERHCSKDFSLTNAGTPGRRCFSQKTLQIWWFLTLSPEVPAEDAEGVGFKLALIKEATERTSRPRRSRTNKWINAFQISGDPWESMCFFEDSSTANKQNQSTEKRFSYHPMRMKRQSFESSVNWKHLILDQLEKVPSHAAEFLFQCPHHSWHCQVEASTPDRNMRTNSSKKNNLQVCRDIKIAGLKYAQVENQQRYLPLNDTTSQSLYIASSEFLR